MKFLRFINENPRFVHSKSFKSFPTLPSSKTFSKNLEEKNVESLDHPHRRSLCPTSLLPRIFALGETEAIKGRPRGGQAKAKTISIPSKKSRQERPFAAATERTKEYAEEGHLRPATIVKKTTFISVALITIFRKRTFISVAFLKRTFTEKCFVYCGLDS